MGIQLLLQRSADVRADRAREQPGEKVDEPGHAAVRHRQVEPVQRHRARGQHLMQRNQERKWTSYATKKRQKTDKLEVDGCYVFFRGSAENRAKYKRTVQRARPE